jgi:hypothetical protein
MKVAFFRRKILDWRPVILKLPSVMSLRVAGALAFYFLVSARNADGHSQS